MQVSDADGNVLEVNVNSITATFDVSTSGGALVELTLDQIRAFLPSLVQAKAALEEIVLNKRKLKLEGLKTQVTVLETEIAEIEALINT